MKEETKPIKKEKSNENDNGMYIDNNNTFEAEDDEFGMKDAIPLLSEKKVRRISESVKNRIEILYNLRFLKTLNCKRRLLSTLNYFKAVEKRLSHDFIIDDEAATRIAQLAQLHKLAKAPIARAEREVVVGVLDDALCRILLVLHRQAKVRLPRPSLRQRDRVCDIEVDGELRHIVPAGEE